MELNEDQAIAFEDHMSSNMAALSGSEIDKLTKGFGSIIGTRSEIEKRLEQAKARSSKPAFSGTFFGTQPSSPRKPSPDSKKQEQASEVAKDDPSAQYDVLRALIATLSKETKRADTTTQGTALALSANAKAQEVRHVEILKAINAQTTYIQRLEHEVASLRKQVSNLALSSRESLSEGGQMSLAESLSPGILRPEATPDTMSGTSLADDSSEPGVVLPRHSRKEAKAAAPSIVWSF